VLFEGARYLYDRAAANQQASAEWLQTGLTTAANAYQAFVQNVGAALAVRAANQDEVAQIHAVQEWEVEILNSRRIQWQLQYLVKWKGYSEPTWEPEDNLAEVQAIDRFQKHSRIHDGVSGNSPRLSPNPGGSPNR